MATTAARLSKLEKKAASLEKRIAKQQETLAEFDDCCTQVEKWIKLQVKWSDEVTNMIRQINWGKLAQDYPGGGGTNPPQTPPKWPL